MVLLEAGWAPSRCNFAAFRSYFWLYRSQKPHRAPAAALAERHRPRQALSPRWGLRQASSCGNAGAEPSGGAEPRLAVASRHTGPGPGPLPLLPPRPGPEANGGSLRRTPGPRAPTCPAPTCPAPTCPSSCSSRRHPAAAHRPPAAPAVGPGGGPAPPPWQPGRHPRRTDGAAGPGRALRAAGRGQGGGPGAPPPPPAPPRAPPSGRSAPCNKGRFVFQVS